MQKEKLNTANRKFLKKQLKIGFVSGLIITSLFFLLFLLASYNLLETNMPAEWYLYLGLLAGFLIQWIINRKYYKDLWYGFKEIQIRKIKQKKCKTDYEAGSSLGFSLHSKDNALNLSMRKYQVWSVLIDHYSYPVDKELWNKICEGDFIRLEFAPFSREVLNISLA